MLSQEPRECILTHLGAAGPPSVIELVKLVHRKQEPPSSLVVDLTTWPGRTTYTACETGGGHSGRPDEARRTRTCKDGVKEWLVMSWFVLVVSGLLEAVWAVALDRSDGFSRLVPSAVFAGSLALSMAGLALALRDLPVGTAYAVWVGIGAVLTVVYGMAKGLEPVSISKLICLTAIIAGVIGLKALH
jgi:quaternary ammonium compound-resistance protein SugE